MLEPKASRFYQATLQSGLADAAALQACWDAIPPEKRTPDHIDRRIARQAVTSGLLTLWQAQQLIAGRSSGFKVDRYTLLELIGQGGMGRVYLARDTRLNRRVAVKILSPERVNNPRAIARFHREALVGAQLQHENLVRIYDEGEANNKCYLVMEFIEGKNIGQMMAESGPIPPAVAARLARQVALGLEHAQRKGLIHRDVNPYNILVTRDGTAKLTDLGLAIDLAEQDRVTRDGATVGTFDYVSPEQARHSHSVDTRSDIYSLGCSLYHMLTGRVPFPGASLPEKLFGHQSKEPEPIRNLAPDVPEGLAAVVSRTMRKSPDDRYATPLELAQALEPFADEFATPVGNGLAPSGRPPTRAEATVTRQIPSPRAPAAEPPPTSPVPTPPMASPGSLPGTDPEPDPMLSGTTPPATGSGEVGLYGLDFGPEPPLSGGATARSRPRPRPRAPAGPADGGKPAGPGDDLKRRLLPAALAALVAAAAAGVYAYRSYARGAAPPKARPVDRGRSAAGGAGAEARATPSPPGLPTPQGQEVAVMSGDGTVSIEPNFRSAMRAAIGGRGHVLLLNTAPLEVPAAEASTMSGGKLVIKAGEGVSPVLHVEVKGGRPFLSTRTDTRLTMVGVSVVVKYLEPGDHPAAAIEAGGDVTLDRCAFRVEGQAPGSRALAVEGGTLTATGCWFENFERPLDVACFGGSVTVLRHCMLIGTHPDEPGDPATAPAPSAWAVRLRNMPGGFAATGRRLTMDRCTVKTQGFLDLAGFSPQAPAAVELTGCAVSADALLAWGPGEGGTTAPLTRDAMKWSGAGNQYDVHGESWVRLAIGPMPDGPSDPASWTRLLAEERDPVAERVRFATDPATIFEHAEPRDFAVADQGGRAVGASPEHVGPGAKPTPPAVRKP